MLSSGESPGQPLTPSQQRGEGTSLCLAAGEVVFMDTAEEWPLQLGGDESPAPSTRPSLSPPLWGSVVPLTAWWGGSLGSPLRPVFAGMGGAAVFLCGAWLELLSKSFLSSWLFG